MKLALSAMVAGMATSVALVDGHSVQKWLADPLEARTTGNSVEVSGYTAYLGLAPGEVVRHHASMEDLSMHGGPPPGTTHVTVAFFRTASGERVTSAKVSAAVETLDGRVLERHRLDRMVNGGAVTWGNYFRLPAREQYRVSVTLDTGQRDRVAIFQRLDN